MRRAWYSAQPETYDTTQNAFRSGYPPGSGADGDRRLVCRRAKSARLNSMPVDHACSRAPDGATTRWPWAVALLGLLAYLLVSVNGLAVFPAVGEDEPWIAA